MTWEGRVESFWASADDRRPEQAIEAMTALIAERQDGDPVALYELASVYDFVGREQEAVPLYRQALSGGLGGDRRAQAVIQLASSLRNIGEANEAIALLSTPAGDTTIGDAGRAFLALALHDAGRHDEVLRVALLALIPTLSAYRRALTDYANALVESPDPSL